MKDKINDTDLFDFIKRSPDAFFTANTIAEILISEGYTRLFEEDKWKLDVGGKYFVIRSGSSVIAFRTVASPAGFMISATHSDSPAFRVKLNEENVGCYAKLSTEKYGGMIYSSWLDRPLSVCGRVVIRTESGANILPLNIDYDLAVIPSVAIHLNRSVNDGYKYNPAVDLLPVYALGKKGGIREVIAKELGIEADKIISADLTLYCRDEGRTVGADNELILAPRLDDLSCVYASVKGFLNADISRSVPVLAVFDNEEVGSATKQGASSGFLYDVLSRIAGNEEKYTRLCARSFMISADNAHAQHPNHPELSDAKNAPVLGGGVAVKHNASQRYATDAVSEAVFKTLCEREGVRVQDYYNRADLPGGSTLGSISNTRVAVPAVDVGIPQLAMHSAAETICSSDLSDMEGIMRRLYSSSLILTDRGFEI